MTQKEALTRIYDIVGEICGDDWQAKRWLCQLMTVAQVWDNFVDSGDKPHAGQVDEVFTALLLEWPNNSFFRANIATLLPAMANAVSAWKFSDAEKRARQRAYDVGSELIGAVAFLKGGHSLHSRYMPEVRALCLALMDANDKE